MLQKKHLWDLEEQLRKNTEIKPTIKRATWQPGYPKQWDIIIGLWSMTVNEKDYSIVIAYMSDVLNLTHKDLFHKWWNYDNPECMLLKLKNG